MARIPIFDGGNCATRTPPPSCSRTVGRPCSKTEHQTFGVSEAGRDQIQEVFSKPTDDGLVVDGFGRGHKVPRGLLADTCGVLAVACVVTII